MPKDTGIGASTKRREDVRFLTGRGRYSDDIQTQGECAAVFARSTVANGVIKSIDTTAAAAMPGVLAVFTGEDFVDVGGNPAGWLINSRDGEPMKEPKRPVLAHGKVRHVGDAYAAVVAETVQQARDADAEAPPAEWGRGGGRRVAGRRSHVVVKSSPADSRCRGVSAQDLTDAGVPPTAK